MKTMILLCVLSSAALSGASTILVEDWENGFIDETVWRHFGDPQAVLYSGEGRNGSWGFDCNGNSMYGSGVCTQTDYDLSLLPRVTYWANGSDTFDSWQNIYVCWSEFPSRYYGGPGAQPERLLTLAVTPGFSIHSIKYWEQLSQPGVSVSEPWLHSLYCGVWMPYEIRINPWGTISFFRNDTLRWESKNSIYPEQWNEQCLVLEGESWNHHQLIDDILLTFPALNEDWEQGLSPLDWCSWGGLQPRIVPGGGLLDSQGLVPGEEDLNGLASWQVFDLSSRPLVWFSMKGSSSQPGYLRAGWSETDGTFYGGSPPGCIIYVSADPSSGLIEYFLDGEISTEAWIPSMNDAWQQFTIRINSDSTVSFFRNDTLRYTTSQCLELSSFSAQAMDVRGLSSEGLPVLDELLVYPSIPVPAGYLTPLNGVCSWDGCNGWAVGDGGRLFQTRNFGETWDLVQLETQLDLNRVEFVSAEHGWAAGSSGSLLITLDGENWFVKDTGFPGALSDVSFADDLTGWVSGENGLLLKTENAGFNWSAQSHPVTGDVNGVSSVNHSLVFIAGESGQVARTDDGENWSILPHVTSADLYSIDFFGSQRGFAVGAGGTVIATFDGGNTWEVQDSPVSSSLLDVSFFDGDHGFAVGECGAALYTADGGIHWEVLETPGYGDCFFTGVAAFAETAAWAVCDRGTVLLGDFYSGSESGGTAPPSSMLRLCQNPVGQGSGIPLEVFLPLGAKASVYLYDLSGRLVAASDRDHWEAGLNSLILPLVGFAGNPLPPGVYFLQCVSGSYSESRSLVILNR